MRTISVAGLAALASMEAVESIFIVEIEWAGGPTFLSYADRAVASIPGKILSVNQFDNTINIATGNSQSISLTLDDTDGSIKAILDMNDVHKNTARVYQYFGGLVLSDKFLLFSGKLNSPITWSEGERTVEVTIVSQLEDREFGFSAEQGDFDFIPKNLIGKAWPSLFGTVIDSPCLQMNLAVQGTTLSGVGIISGEAAHLAVPLGGSNCGLGRSLGNMATQVSLLDITGAQWAAVGAGRKAVEHLNQANQIREQMSNAVFQYQSQQSCAAQQRIDTINEAIERGQGPSILPILGGEDFPQGQTITLNIGGGLFTGVFHDDGFHISKRRHVENEEAAEEDADKATNGACSQSQAPTDSNFSISADGPQGAEERHGFHVCTDSNQNPTVQQVAKDFWADAGTRVTLASDEPLTYIVSIVPGTILTVKAFKSLNNIKKLVEVPASYYTKNVVNYGPVTAVQVVLHKPLTSRLEEGWTDDLFVTFESTIGPNTVDIIDYILDNYSDLVRDDTSFDYVETKVEPFPMSHPVLERMNTIDVLNHIALNARCAFWIVNGVAFLKYLPEEPDADDTIGLDDIGHQSTELGITDTEDIVTKLIGEWVLSWADDTHEQIIFRYNIDKYGTQEDEMDLTWFNQPDCVLHAGTFWLIRKSNTWKRLKFKTALHKLNLEVFDTVLLDVPYVSTAPVKGVVETASYDSASNTIDFEILVPVRLGEMTKYPWFWPATEELKFPSDGSILPTTTQLPVGYTGVIGDPSKPLRFRGEWSSVTAYLVNDAILFNGETYICFQNNTNKTPTNQTYWRLASSVGNGTIFVGGPNVVHLGKSKERDLNDARFHAQSLGLYTPPGSTVTFLQRPRVNLKLNYAASPLPLNVPAPPKGWPYLLDDGK